MLRYAALAVFCASLIGCSDPSCPEGKQKIGTVCFRIDAGADSVEADDAIDDDASTVAPAAPDAALHDASPGASDGSSQATNASTEAGASGAVSSLCANSNGGCDPLTTCGVVAGKVVCGACPDSYSGDGATGCQQAPVCSDNPCGDNAACTASAIAPGYACSCKEGFTLEGTECVDIDECFEGTAGCHMTSVCANTEGSYDCTCPAGYSGGTLAGFACAPRIVVGNTFACALQSDGRVKCWGANSHGQLGDGTTLSRLTPVFVKGLDHVMAVAAHDSTSVCALQDDGRVACWGDNTAGQLGDGTTDSHFEPIALPTLTSAIAISVRDSRACAVVRDGGLRCWGSAGRLGNGGVATSLTPQAIPGIPQMASVEVGWAGSGCAVTRMGTLWCWGYEAGDVPAQVSTVTDVVHHTMGYPGQCAMRTSGQIRCWGRDPNMAVVPSFGEVVSVACGLEYTHLVRRDGTVHGWRGIPTYQLEESFSVDVSDAVAVATGGAGIPSACVVLRDGTVRCWGINSQGQLGDGTTTSTGETAATTVSGLDLW